MARWILIAVAVVGLTWRVNCEVNNSKTTNTVTVTRTSERYSNDTPNFISNEDKYVNYTLIRIYPMNDGQIQNIINFTDPDGMVEVLKRSREYNDSTDVLVPPKKMGFIDSFIRENNLHSQIVEHNYGRRLEYNDRIPRRRQMRNIVFQYNSYSAILEYLNVLAKEHPDLIKLQNLGTSFQGRTINLVKISTNPGGNNPVIFIDAGIHAREWVAPAMALYLIHRLVKDPEAIRKELNGVDWFILPVVNPDGYEFTRATPSNRLWRKTMSRNGNGDCYGVDGNRNYGFKWAVSGVSHNPCDKETYAGPSPFSEIETQHVKKVMLDNKDRIKLYVSLHAYGQYLVYPWGYTGDILPPDWRKLDKFAKKVSSAVRNAGGDPFKVMSAGKWYPAAGGSDDFAFGVIGVPYSYTMEITDGYEFTYPEELLKRTLPKLYMGFRAMAEHIRKEFRNKSVEE